MSVDDLSRSQLIEAIHGLEDELDRMENERDRFEALAKRTKADFENYKNEQDQRRQRWQRDAIREVANDLIKVLDNLERALMSADEDSSLVMGVEMVADELYNTLAEHGLERIDPDKDFDPNMHTAVDTRHHEEENTVLEVRRPGYTFGDRVLREAEVVVGTPQQNDSETDTRTDSEGEH